MRNGPKFILKILENKLVKIKKCQINLVFEVHDYVSNFNIVYYLNLF